MRRTRHAIAFLAVAFLGGVILLAAGCEKKAEKPAAPSQPAPEAPRRAREEEMPDESRWKWNEGEGGRDPFAWKDPETKEPTAPLPAMPARPAPVETPRLEPGREGTAEERRDREAEAVEALSRVVERLPDTQAARRDGGLRAGGGRRRGASLWGPRGPSSRPVPWQTALAGEELWIIERSAIAKRPSAPDADIPTQGELRAKVKDEAGEEKEIPLPLKHTDVKGEVSAFVATGV